MSKKRIIAIITIIVLLLAAGISVGVFLYGRAETQATDGTQTTDPNQQTDGNQNNDGNQTIDGSFAEGENSTTPPAEGDETTQSGEGNVTGDRNAAGEGNTTIENDNANANNQNANNNNVNVEDIEETTVTRTEEQDRLVSEGFWDWWQPMKVAVTPTELGIEIPQITVEKIATVNDKIDNLIYAGQDITYIIAVTNNSETVVENIEITDRIPENTTYVDGSIKDAFIVENEDTKLTTKNIEGATNSVITAENQVIGLKWTATIQAGETVFVSFKVNVNPEATGTILNTAIANGEKSNETQTSIIKANKSSIVTRNGETVESKLAKVGDRIIYTITVENTGLVKGTVDITDTIPEGTKLTYTGLNVDETTGKITWSNVELPAATMTEEGEVVNGKAAVTFEVEVVTIDGTIENVATVEDKETNKDIIKTADIKVEKVVSSIKRGEEYLDIETQMPEVKEGDVIEYTITVTNTGSVDLTNVIADEKLLGIDVNPNDLQIGDLAAGKSAEIKATYIVTYERDIKGKEDREIYNKVYVSGETVPDTENPDDVPEKVEDDDDEIVPVAPDSRLEIEKTATAVNGTVIEDINNVKVRPGDIVEYTITVTNTGNATLTNVVVTDTLNVQVGDSKETIEAGKPIKTIEALAPIKTVEIKTYYTVVESDVTDAEPIHNVAKVTATTPDEEKLEEKSEEDVPVNPDTEVTVTKAWADANNQDGIRPATVTVNLMNGTTEVEEVVLSAENNWGYTFKKLPTFNAEGVEIAYTVTEDTVAEYSTVITGDAITGYTVTNTHEVYLTTVSVEKVWNDSNDQDRLRTTSVTVNLLADGSAVDEIVLSEENEWKHTFIDLPLNKEGEAIAYTVAEVEVSDEYKSEITGNATEGYTITNTHKPYETSVSVEKVWEDDNNRDGIRPNSITVNLLADGISVKEIALNEANNWQHTFENLPLNKDGVAIAYTVAEVEVSDEYTSEITGTATEGYTITNTHEIYKTSVSVEKIWEDDNDRDRLRAESITVNLLADGSSVEEITLNESNGWNYIFRDLPVNNDGEKISYTIAEVGVPQGYTPEITGDAEGGYTITNTHEIYTTRVPVKKVWEDEDDQDGLRADSITVNLLADGTKVDEIVLDDSNDWEDTFTDLPLNNAGVPIAYTVEEIGVSTEYTSTTTGDAETGYIITNTHEPYETNVSVEKKWEDADNQDGKRTTSIKVNLLADDVKVAEDVLDKDNSWKHTFPNLPLNNAGVAIKYTVEEVEVPTGYTSLTTGDATDGYTITNTHIPEKTEVKVIKVWDDNNNANRPTEVTVKLMNGTTELQEQKLSARNEWTYTFENLDKYANGQEIPYTVTEEPVAGYVTSITGDRAVGYTVTNTYVTQTKTKGEKTPDTVKSGDTIEYVITIQNHGTTPVADYKVQDAKLLTLINSGKIEMLNDSGSVADKSEQCIKVTTNKAGVVASYINAETIGGENYKLDLDANEVITINIKVRVANALPGEQIINTLVYGSGTVINNVEAPVDIIKTVPNTQEAIVVIDLSLSMAMDVEDDGQEGNDPMARSYERTRWHALNTALQSFIDSFMYDGTYGSANEKYNENQITIIGYNANITENGSYILFEKATTDSQVDALITKLNGVFTQTHFNTLVNAVRGFSGDKITDWNNEHTTDIKLNVPPEEREIDVDGLKDTKIFTSANMTKLNTLTNIESGLLKAKDVLDETGSTEGKHVILMTDGIAGTLVKHGATCYTSTNNKCVCTGPYQTLNSGAMITTDTQVTKELINTQIEKAALKIKESGVDLYTVSLALEEETEDGGTGILKTIASTSGSSTIGTAGKLYYGANDKDNLKQNFDLIARTLVAGQQIDDWTATGEIVIDPTIEIVPSAVKKVTIEFKNVEDTTEKTIEFTNWGNFAQPEWYYVKSGNRIININKIIENYNIANPTDKISSVKGKISITIKH